MRAFIGRYGESLGAGLAGAAMALGQPPFGLWPLIFPAGAALFLIWRGVDGWRAFRRGWMAGFGFFGVALHWIVEPFLVDAATHGWMAPFAFLILPGGLALFWGAAFALAARWRRWFGATGFRAAATLAVFWSLVEFLRSFILTGFPWALPAYAWTETPVAQIASVTGPYGLSLLTIALSVFAGVTLSRGGLTRYAPALCALVLVGIGWAWGAARVSAATEAEGPLIRIIQTAVKQSEKWDRENVSANFDMLMALSASPGAAAPAVVIWPESAVTFPIDMAEGARERIGDGLGDASLILGSLRVDGGPDSEITMESRWRNSLFLLGTDGEAKAIFDKNHLVPFGEYLPLENVMRRIGVAGLAGVGAGIVAGEEHVVMKADGAPPFSPLICYEMIFARETMRASEGAKWMVLVTNDAWFGGWAGRAQHLGMARFRAIETGLPIARSANQGLSAMIDSYGRITAGAVAGRAVAIDAQLPVQVVSTIYRSAGEGSATLAMCVLLVFSTSGQLRRKNVMNKAKN